METEEFNLDPFKVGARVKMFDTEYNLKNGVWQSGYARGTITGVSVGHIKIRWDKGPYWDMTDITHPLWEVVDGVILLDTSYPEEVISTPAGLLYEKMVVLEDDYQRWKFLLENSRNPHCPFVSVANDETYVEWEDYGVVTFEGCLGNDLCAVSLLGAAGLRWNFV